MQLGRHVGEQDELGRLGGGLRVPEADEVMGLDVPEMGVPGYIVPQAQENM